MRLRVAKKVMGASNYAVFPWRHRNEAVAKAARITTRRNGREVRRLRVLIDQKAVDIERRGL